MPCDFCAGPGLPDHRYGSLLCQRGAYALRRGLLGWSHAHIVACRLVCPECGRLHDTFHTFEACLDSHGIFMGWGIPKHRDGTVYRRGPARPTSSRVASRPSSTSPLEQRFLGDGKVPRRVRPPRVWSAARTASTTRSRRTKSRSGWPGPIGLCRRAGSEE